MRSTNRINLKQHRRIIEESRKRRRYVRKGNRREEIARSLAKARGYEVLQAGWPDMLLWRESDQKAVLVEVKAKAKAKGYHIPGQTNLNPDQKRMHEILKKLGLNVQIIYIE